MANVPLPPTHQGSAKIERIVDYEANVLCVLGFLACGDGGVEAGRLLGLLGMKNATTMGPRSFGIVEEYIGPVTQQYTKEIVHNNLVEEVRLSYGNRTDENGLLLFDLWKEEKLDKNNHDLWPKLTVTHDMGWQGRASGNQYNSMTGDGLLFGALTRKAISFAVVSKGCSFCKGWKRGKRKDQPIPDHDCRKNWDGSSGAMEPFAILEMLKRLYTDKQVVLEFVVTDDDSSIKSKLKWSNADHMLIHGLTTPPTIINSNGNEVVRPDHGELPRHMPEPEFYADPNHRKKTWKKTLYQLLQSSVKQRKTLTHMDVLRLGTNFAYVVRTLPGKTDAEMEKASKAVIEHHFDCHDYCGGWCSRKNQTEDDKSRKKKCYRSKEKDAALYAELKNRIERFITLDALHEVSHGYDTLCNELFNNVAAWIAPKNKVYGSSQSLKNRVCVAIGLVTVGTLTFYREIFNRLGVTMAADTEHYIRLQSQCKENRRAKEKSTEGKKRRVEKYHKNLLTKTVIAKREKSKREGTYHTGMGIDGGYTQDELNKAQAMYPRDYQRAAARAEKKVTKCPYSSKKAIQGTLPLTPVLALNANTYCPNIFRKGHWYISHLNVRIVHANELVYRNSIQNT